MALGKDSKAKIAAALAGDTDLFNELDDTLNEYDAEINRMKTENEAHLTTIEKNKDRENELLGQVSNLYGRLPSATGGVQRKDLDQTLDEVLSEEW